jgi:hypothetical protein
MKFHMQFRIVINCGLWAFFFNLNAKLYHVVGAFCMLYNYYYLQYDLIADKISNMSVDC